MPGSVFHGLRDAPQLYYHIYEQAKMKYGSPQLDSDGKQRMRQVSRPIAILKEEQRSLLKRLNEFDLPDCMYGGVRGRNNILNALQHING